VDTSIKLEEQFFKVAINGSRGIAHCTIPIHTLQATKPEPMAAANMSWPARTTFTHYNQLPHKTQSMDEKKGYSMISP
jgi:hypothetical protein